MLKLCLFRGLRILVMLVVAACFVVAALFVSDPNINSFKSYLEEETKLKLASQDVQFSDLSILWLSGPALHLGQVDISSRTFSLQQAQVYISYPWLNVFHGVLGPKIVIRGGGLLLNTDTIVQEKEVSNDWTVALEHVNFSYVFQQETQTINQLNATIFPGESDMVFKGEGFDLLAAFDDQRHLKKVRLFVSNFSCLPSSWLAYTKGLKQMSLNVQRKESNEWDWRTMATAASDGKIEVPSAHFVLPLDSLEAYGSLTLAESNEIQLAALTVEKLAWKHGENFGQFTADWRDNHLHIQAYSGSVSMPLLWSWLWTLGDDAWHAWLSSMKAGRIDSVVGYLDLDWAQPLSNIPTRQNLLDMRYRVKATASNVDIALGLAGDSLSRMRAEVHVDEQRLEANISKAVLAHDAGIITGTFAIDWQDSLMNIKASGDVDVGKVHTWLHPDSAQEIHWQSAPAQGNIEMRWYATRESPEYTRGVFKPTADWHLAPKGVALIAHSGEAVFDINQGLELNHMHITSPWLAGDIDLSLNKNKAWAMESFALSANAPLQEITDKFSLPIDHPGGDVGLILKYASGFWIGDVDLSRSIWRNFLGEQRQNTRASHILLSGKPKEKGSDILPIDLTNIRLMEDNLDITGHALITESVINFNFEEIYSPAFVGKFRLSVPLIASLPIGIEVDADYVDRPLLTSYLDEKKQQNATLMPKISIFSKVKWMQWQKSHAENFSVQFSSGDQGRGHISADYFDSGGLELEQVDISFSLLTNNKFDLHQFAAMGSGQKLVISGSVERQISGEFVWQGLAVMDGEFGQLMAQAELNKLFKDGSMNAVFLGKGIFKEGEPWFRGLDGQLRLRVDKGRIKQGGTLTRLLAAISLVDLPKYLIFQRQDVIGEGLFYDKMQIEAAFEEEKLNIKQLAFLSSALDAGGKGEVNLATGMMDVVIVARPWQNLEALIGNIPLLGGVLAGKDKSLLRKVYGIHGPASDALVDELEPESAGLPSSGLLERLFSLPGKLFGN